MKNGNGSPLILPGGARLSNLGLAPPPTMSPLEAHMVNLKMIFEKAMRGLAPEDRKGMPNFPRGFCYPVWRSKPMFGPGNGHWEHSMVLPPHVREAIAKMQAERRR